MIINGFTYLSEDRSIPFHFEDGYLDLFLGISPFVLKEEQNNIIGQKHGMMSGGFILFHLSSPLKSNSVLEQAGEAGIPVVDPILFGSVRQRVDFYIDEYVENSSFTEMKCSFPELDYFIPSSTMCPYSFKGSQIKFQTKTKIVTSFTFKYKGQTTTFSLKLSTAFHSGIFCHAETKSFLVLEFDETNDLDFILELYYLIHSVFSFICNRQNIALDSAVLFGMLLCNRPEVSGNVGSVIVKKISTSSSIFVLNRYKEKNEDTKVITETIQYGALSSDFQELFSLFVVNKISVYSIHSSRSARRLIDLKQSLHIYSAFEYYLRTFLPEISSTETIKIYDEVRVLIQCYIDKQSGEKRKRAKHLYDSLTPIVSLQEKIRKVFDGYDHWQGLSNILSEYFGNDVSGLADVANQWRNELAHEKREYGASKDVISSVRLVEHLNYCIVLRTAGYSDNEIKTIVDKVLTR